MHAQMKYRTRLLFATRPLGHKTSKNLNSLLFWAIISSHLEVVNGHKVREEREDVLDLEERALVEDGHCLLDVILLRDDVLGDAQPQLTLQRLILFRLLCTLLGQLHIHLDQKNRKLKIIYGVLAT